MKNFIYIQLLLYKLNYKQKLVELKTLKTYLKPNFAKHFMKSFELPINISIFSTYYFHRSFDFDFNDLY